jgi:GTP-binding protein LepA
MANVYLALENNLEIITCVNKIDLPNADAEKVMLEVESTIGLDTSNSIKCSAKTGTRGFSLLLQPHEKKINSFDFELFFNTHHCCFTPFLKPLDKT